MKVQYKFFTLLLIVACSGPAEIVEVGNSQSETNEGWGSASAQGPSFGFYGQEFEFQKEVKIVSFSTFIVDHHNHKDPGTAINFGIWNFDGQPSDEVFMSGPIGILKDDLGKWKKFEFETPITLSKGRYVFGVGQNELQGFVAFGNGTKTEDYKSGLWARGPFGGLARADEWIDLGLYVTSNTPNITDEMKRKIASSTVMMKLEFN